MRLARWLFPLCAVAFGASAGGAGCNLIFGDHEIVGEDRFCSDDSDCDDDERCSEDTGGVCRERCIDKENAGPQCLQQGIEDLRVCTDDKTCTEPIGTPCDADDLNPDGLYCGADADGLMCAGENSDGEEVPGYCTKDCGENTPPCPDGYVCGSVTGNNDRCVQCASGAACTP